jgi:hypothetical protein
MVMTLNPHDFMATMEKRMSFTDEDKALLKSQANWGQQKVDGKPEELRDALGRICMIDLAFIEQAYVEVSSAAVLQETGWTAGLFKRLVATGAGSM